MSVSPSNQYRGVSGRRMAEQLPPGRHNYPRGFVKANQRDRIRAAVADVVGLQGYVSMSVEDIVVTAGVSRRTFYDNYRDKEHAFLEAYDDVSAQLLARLIPVARANTGFTTGLIACLRMFLEFSAANPQYADMCIVEVLAAGPNALARRDDLLRQLAVLLHKSAVRDPDASQPPTITAETVIGGIFEVTYSRVLAGQASTLPELLPELAYSAMLPYLGHEVAGAELHRLKDSITPAQL